MKKFMIVIFLIAIPVYADETLLKKHNCTACHSVDKKLVGPSFKDVSTKYKSDKSASNYLSSKIIKGSSGVWGAVPMPPNSSVSEVEAKKLSNFIINLK